MDAYLKKLRSILVYTGVSDGKMQEGSLRCDVNLSVRKKGAAEFGTRTEMKNLNSFQFIGKAIAYEFRRQVEALEAGKASCRRHAGLTKRPGKPIPCAPRRTRTITAISPIRIWFPSSFRKNMWNR